MVVFEAAAQAGGQILLAAGLKRRREILGIVDWRLAECERLGVEFRYNTWAEAADVEAEQPNCVVIATGGLPSLDLLQSGQHLATTSWDILSGSTKPARDVIMIDTAGSHAAMTLAEFLAERVESLEVVTPDRIFAPDIGATSFPSYFRALAKADAKLTPNLRIDRLEQEGNKIAAVFLDEYSGQERRKTADQVVLEYGTMPLDDLYFELKEASTNRGEVDVAALLKSQPQTLKAQQGAFRLFRIGDAVAGRNIHAAILDAYRLMVAY